MKMTVDVTVAPAAAAAYKVRGKTVHAVNIKKALAKSLAIFKLQKSRMLSQDRILYRDEAPVHTTATVQLFKWQQRHQDDSPPTLHICQISPLRTFFYYRE